MKVAIIMGSNSDWPVLEAAEKTLKDFGVEVEVVVASAHRTPDVVQNFAAGARDRGVEVIMQQLVPQLIWAVLSRRSPLFLSSAFLSMLLRWAAWMLCSALYRCPPAFLLLLWLSTALRMQRCSLLKFFR